MGNEWLIIAGVVVLLFGGTQIPKLARSLGQAQKEFKQGQTSTDKGSSGAKADSVDDEPDAPREKKP